MPTQDLGQQKPLSEKNSNFTRENSGDSSPPAKTLKITPNGGAASDKSAHNTAPSAVVVVSSKTSDATPKMSLQERMLALQENFKLDSSTQGAEAIRRQREEEMNVVRNRWKCGLPSDGSSKPITAEDNTLKTSAAQPSKEPAMVAQNSVENNTQTPAMKDVASAKVNTGSKVPAADANNTRAASVSTGPSPKKINLLPNKPVSIESSVSHSVSAVKESIVTSTPSQVKTVSKISSPAARTPSSSIYALVKKASSAKPPVGQLVASPVVVPTSSASGTPAQKRGNDTFSDSGESDCEDQSKQEDGATAETNLAATPTAQFDRDMEALEADASEDDSHDDNSVNCDGELDAYMDDSAGSEAVDSFSFHGDVGVKRVPVGMRADDSESDEEAGAGDVNALLDSVLDPDAEVSAEQPEEEPYEVIIRPKERATPVARPQSESCAQAAQSRSAMKRHSPSAGHDEAGASNMAAKRVTWHNNRAASETDATEERAIVYTLDDYRAMVSNKGNSTPKVDRVIVVQTQHQQTPNNKQPRTEQQPKVRVSEVVAKQRHMEMVTQQQNIISQASNALNVCCSTGLPPGCQEQVECHRVLLMACKRRQACVDEMNRLLAGTSPLLFQRDPASPRANVTISHIRLPLKSDYLTKLGGDNSSCHFICLIRHGHHVTFTPMLSHNDVTNGCLELPDVIKLDDMDAGFTVTVEVYQLHINGESGDQQQPPRKKKSFSLTPKKAKFVMPVLQSPGGPMAARLSDFAAVGSLTLTTRSLGKTQFTLDHVPFTSLLQGTLQLTLTCVMENAVECRGFLTMFDDVSGFGAWHRRWFALQHDVLRFWKYPENETNKEEPIGSVELKQCITDTVGLVSRDVCARPNTFELVTVRQQQRGDQETLVTRCYNTVTTSKNWLSADTREDRELWCSKLNDALTNVRAWNTDALRPVKHSNVATNV